ncbi:MAG: mucoidy inhibitor MuiA family protein [Candidatus Heimdallarchaeota archaeon]
MSKTAETILKTAIERVVVYLDGARIFRSGKTELKKGYQLVRVPGLTKKLIKDSVRVSGKGKGSLGAIDVETKYQEEVSHEGLKKLIQEEKILQKELIALQEKLEFARHQNDKMLVLSEKFATEFPQWLASGESQIATLSEFLAFETKSKEANLKKRQKFEDDIEKLTLKIQTLQAEINKFRNLSHVEQTTDIVIGVDVTQAGPFIFDFSYQAKGVSWEPSYDVDLKIENAVLKGVALVNNRTLEDWKNVALTISTAVFKPIRIIEPDPFYIDIYSPRPSSRMMSYAAAPAPMRKMKKAAKEDVMDYEREESLEELAIMDEPTAQIKESPSGVQSFEISGKWSIPSDGNNHPVTLTTHELKTVKEFYWSATASLGVIALDKITNGDAIILAGNAKVYADGEFIGETFIDQIAPGEEFKLGAREELKMKAEKKLLKRVKEKAGLVKGKRSISYNYELKINNYRKLDAAITIKDVIPYSHSERIKVKNFKPSLVPVKENLGIQTWDLKLKPGEEYKVTYSYEVEWEKDYSISPPLP